MFTVRIRDAMEDTDRMDANALRALAERYRNGDGVGKDPAEAVRLLTAASNMGDADAASSLGYMLMVGEGVESDRAAAEVHLLRAADAGNPVAMSNLGVLLSMTDPEMSEEW